MPQIIKSHCSCLFLAIYLAFGTFLNAEIWDFENLPLPEIKGWDFEPEIVLNPLPDEGNPSRTVVKWQRAEGLFRGGLYVMTPAYYDFSENPICQIRVWSPKAGPVLFRAVNRGETRIEDRWAYIRKAERWETLRVSFLGLPSETFFWVGIMPFPESTEPCLMYWDDFGFTRPQVSPVRVPESTETSPGMRNPNGFHIRKGQLKDANRIPFLPRGSSIEGGMADAHSQFANEQATSVMAELGLNTVRILWNPQGDPYQLKRLLKKAEAEGLAVWITPQCSLDASVDFWNRPDVKGVMSLSLSNTFIGLKVDPLSFEPLQTAIRGLRKNFPELVIALELQWTKDAGLEDNAFKLREWLNTEDFGNMMVYWSLESAAVDGEPFSTVMNGFETKGLPTGVIWNRSPAGEDSLESSLASLRQHQAGWIASPWFPNQSKDSEGLIEPENPTQLTPLGSRYLLGRHGAIETSRRATLFDNRPNQPPYVAKAIRDITLAPGVREAKHIANLKQVFEDPESGDALKYRVDYISQPEDLEVSIDEESNISVMWKSGSSGSAIVSIRATEQELYWNPLSADAIFRVTSSDNLALYAPASASSLCDDGSQSVFLTDGRTDTWWSSLHSPGQWVSIDLRKLQAINYVRIYWDFGYATDFTLMGSGDGSEWQELRQISGNTSMITDCKDLNSEIRYLKLILNTPSQTYGFGIREIEIFPENTKMQESKASSDH